MKIDLNKDSNKDVEKDDSAWDKFEPLIAYAVFVFIVLTVVGILVFIV